MKNLKYLKKMNKIKKN